MNGDAFRQEPRRWGNTLAIGSLGLAVLAALTDNGGRSLWWPPALATAFFATFVAQVVDAYRTGLVSFKYARAKRFQQPVAFNMIVALLVVFAVVCGAMAVGSWAEVLRGPSR
jgi:hypothetical protein